jgi:Na+:H+ antiporter, NhaA family
MIDTTRPYEMIREFLRLESAGGILLVIATICAIICANSALGGTYEAFLQTPVAIQLGALKIAKPLILWINDGLMAIFFFLVGLEIKREFKTGELSSVSQVTLPGLAACGGMAVPALIYAAINAATPQTLSGWAIPAATDIAFALAILSLLGNRVPSALKVLLLAIAIFDDLGAILIIAFFYTDDLSQVALLLALLPIAGLIILNLTGVTLTVPYVLLGIVLWVMVLKSGVHATLAGVITALAVPLTKGAHSQHSVLEDLEEALHPWVAYGILPLFAFANAGVSFAGIGMHSLSEPVMLGVALGLFLGKQIGIFAVLWATIRSGLTPMPRETNWLQLYGVSVVSGIGFTMSLFIGSLAFPSGTYDAPVRLGVLTGSLLSAICGYLLLSAATRKPVGVVGGARSVR